MTKADASRYADVSPLKAIENPTVFGSNDAAFARSTSAALRRAGLARAGNDGLERATTTAAVADTPRKLPR
jgi:hypothetical protein